MPDITGEAIDRLITIEAKNRGMPHNDQQPMHQAARKLAGGRPLSMVCAEALKRALGPKDAVLVPTGALAPGLRTRRCSRRRSPPGRRRCWTARSPGR